MKRGLAFECGGRALSPPTMYQFYRRGARSRAPRKAEVAGSPRRGFFGRGARDKKCIFSVQGYTHICNLPAQWNRASGGARKAIIFHFLGARAEAALAARAGSSGGGGGREGGVGAKMRGKSAQQECVESTKSRSFFLGARDEALLRAGGARRKSSILISIYI